MRRLVDGSDQIDFAIIDLKRVTRIEETGAPILASLVRDFAIAGKQITFVSTPDHAHFLRLLQEPLSAGDQGMTFPIFPDADRAVEWCENRLLAAHSASAPAEQVALADHELCRGLDAVAINYLKGVLQPQHFARGDAIVRKGEAADKLYLLVRGEVSVTIELPNGQVKRLSTLSPGMAFGEMAVVDRTVRSADVRADTAVDCYALSLAAFDQLGEQHPAIKMVVLENLLRNVAHMVSHLNQEVTTLAG